MKKKWKIFEANLVYSIFIKVTFFQIYSIANFWHTFSKFMKFFDSYLLLIMLRCFNYISIFTFIISRFHDIHYIMHVKCNNYNYIKLLNIYLNISEEHIKLSINFSKDYKNYIFLKFKKKICRQIIFE